MSVDVRVGDALDVLATLDAESVQCCVSSPPYFGLRDYGVAGQIGLEPTPDEYVAKLVAVFREVRRVLKADGTLWLNLGDSYWGGKGENGSSKARATATERGYVQSSGTVQMSKRPQDGKHATIKAKDLIGIPWMVAFALRADGWYLRQRLPWVKRNPMPESVTDRPSSAVEEMFLLAKSERYFYDYDAVKRRMAPTSLPRLAQNVEEQNGSSRAHGGTKTMKAVRGDKQTAERAFRNTDLFYTSLESPFGAIGNNEEIIALDVATHPYSEAHFATFPPKLIEPCIRAGSRVGDTVLDPFGGAGTTGLVADRLSRNALLIELNPTYAELARQRIATDAPLFAEVSSGTPGDQT